MTLSTLDHNDELMVATANGDATAFEALANRWMERLIGFCGRKLRDEQLGQDVAQEVFLRVYKHAGDYQPRGKFKAWLYLIANNMVIDETRRRKRDVIRKAICNQRDEDKSDVIDLLAGRVESPVEIVVRRESVRLIYEAMDRLSKDDCVASQCLTLLEFADGESYPEIAARRRMPLPTVKSQSRLARQKLRELV